MSKKLKIEIPDGPPEQQIKMLEDWLKIVDAIEMVTGEAGSTDKTPILEAIAKLKNAKK